MFDDLVKQFLGSGMGKDAVQQIQGQGLTAEQAQGAVQTTAEGAAQQLGSGGGLGDLMGSLAGGGGLGGLAGALGGLAGMGGGAPAAAGGLPPQVVDSIANAVAARVGIAPAMAKTVVSVVLPKVIEFAKSKMGGGGGLGGLLG